MNTKYKNIATFFFIGEGPMEIIQIRPGHFQDTHTRGFQKAVRENNSGYID